jgi:fatty acid amide hydrolase
VLSGAYSPPEIVAVCARRARSLASFRRPAGANAIAQELYAEAFADARRFPLKKPGDRQGLLEGVPVSVKDCIGVRGTYQTGGLAVRTLPGHLSAEDSLVVRALRSAGALVLCRGNVSQCMMLPEAFNAVWGASRNPWDLSRTPGGSSGGDAALVAMGAVPLAVGSDVAGSVRIPAIFCGVAGFKPTPGRVSKRGCMAPRRGDRNGMGLVIPSTPGPIARSAGDCALFCEAVWGERSPMYKADSTLPPLAFDAAAYEATKPLRVGYFVSDGWFEPCAAARRAVMETVSNLKAAGHTVVPFELPSTGWDSYVLYVGLAASEGNMRNFIEGLEGEKISDGYKKLYQAANLPNFLRPLVTRLIDKRRATLVSSTRSGGLSAYELQQLMADAVELRAKVRGRKPSERSERKKKWRQRRADDLLLLCERGSGAPMTSHF